jgi:hypothetical protein
MARLSGGNLTRLHCLPISACLLLLPAIPLAAQAPARTDVYHVMFEKAAAGKAAQLGAFLKTAQGSAHRLVLRHEDGDSWDYVVIEHLGTKAAVDAAGTPVPASARDLAEWHNDTFVNGPAWPEFARALGLTDAAKTANSVYVVSVYRAAPGPRDQLEKLLTAEPGAGDTSAGTVVLQHLEGGPWNYAAVVRYNSWQDFATNESNDRAQMAKGSGQWFDLRDHAAFHNDTLTGRIAP